MNGHMTTSQVVSVGLLIALPQATIPRHATPPSHLRMDVLSGRFFEERHLLPSRDTILTLNWRPLDQRTQPRLRSAAPLIVRLPTTVTESHYLAPLLLLLSLVHGGDFRTWHDCRVAGHRLPHPPLVVVALERRPVPPALGGRGWYCRVKTEGNQQLVRQNLRALPVSPVTQTHPGQGTLHEAYP